MNDMWLNFYDRLIGTEVHNSYTDALDSKGYQYKIFNLEKDFKYLLDIEDDKFQYFVLKQKIFIMIPLRNQHRNIFGFTCRAVNDKAFYNIQMDENYPMVFGLEQLDRMPLNIPVLLCEGIKDVMTLRQIYKCSLAYLTAKPSELLFNFLEQITNKIIFFPDHDKAGLKLKYDREVKEQRYIKDQELKKKFEYYSKHYTPYGKDLGNYWENSEDKDRILNWVKISLKKDEVILN